MPSGDGEVLWPLISIIVLHFTLADGVKKTPSGQRYLGFEHVKAIVTKNAIKVFVWTLLKVSF